MSNIQIQFLKDLLQHCDTLTLEQLINSASNLSSPLTIEQQAMAQELEQLKLKKQQLKDQLNSQEGSLQQGNIKLSKFQVTNHPQQRQSIKLEEIDLLVIFSSPLFVDFVVKGKAQMLPLELLPVTEIRNAVIQTLQKTDKVVKYKFISAQFDRILKNLTSQPLGIQFTLHGEQPFVDKIAFLDYLGRAEVIDIPRFKRLLSDLVQYAPEFIVLTSCHSEEIANMFLQQHDQFPGADHVIYIKSSPNPQKTEADYENIINFLEILYFKFFSNKESICDAFTSTLKEMDKSLGQKKQSFKILVKEQYCSCCLLNSDQGKAINLTVPPKFMKLPDAPLKAVCRQDDIFKIIESINNNRVVTIKGAPGIGKSTLLKILCNYQIEQDDRENVKDGILYNNCSGLVNAESLLNRVQIIFQQKKSSKVSLVFALSQVQEIFSFMIITKITEMIGDSFTLLVLDNIEDIFLNDPSTLKHTLYFLLSECQNLRILISSQCPIGNLLDFKEYVYELATFHTKFGSKLLENKLAQLNISWKSNDITKFLVNMKRKGIIIEKAADYLQPFVELLQGHPQSIAVFAPFMKNKKLEVIYEELAQKLESGGREDQVLQAISQCLNISLTSLNQVNPEAQRFFSIFGLLKQEATIELLEAI